MSPKWWFLSVAPPPLRPVVMGRTLTDNMVQGVAKGFEKKLQLVGVGYRAAADKKELTMNLGFSHPV